MTSFASTSAAAGSKSLQGNLNNITSNTNLELIRDVYRYQILNSFVINNLNTYINLFTTADYTGLKTNYTDAKRKSLSLMVANDRFFYNTNIDSLDGFVYDQNVFNNFRKNSKSLISGLEMAIKQFEQVHELQTDIVYYNSILKSEESIIKYLNEHKEVSQYAFSVSQIFNVRHVLKPWYQRYLSLYGPPGDGVFQNDLMAQIVLDLISEGGITEDQFIKNIYPN